MANIVFNNIGKIYSGGVRAVSNFNLEIKNEEFIIFVGPSGCGKTTVLRMIAGLEEITEGNIYIDEKVINNMEPKDRDIAMVFQNYALYPHMSVYENMAFGLKMRKVPKKEIKEKVMEAAKILGIEDLLDRKPKALSGGQKQRVALGRAIVRHPKVFLMDEPLSNLDAKLRVQTRAEIVKLHQKLNTTFIYVTHDQTEAMTMGDRIVVMKDGIIQQFASPSELYDSPINMFVASFIGSPQMNFLDSTITEENKELLVKISNSNSNFKLPKDRKEYIKDKNCLNKPLILGVRAEDFHTSSIKGGLSIKVVVDGIENLGNEKLLFCKYGNKDIIARIHREDSFNIGDELDLEVDISKVHFFYKDSQKRI